MAAPECGACSPDFTVWVDGLSQNLQIIAAHLARLAEAIDGRVEWAAWIQAGAATIGIFIAIWVPWKQRHDEDRRREEDRRAQAKSLAILIFPELLELRAKLDALRKRAATMLDAPPGIIPSDADIKIELTPELNRAIDRMYLLGPKTSGALLQFVAVISQYNRMMERVIGQGGPMPKFMMGFQSCQKHLETVDTLLDEALREVEKTHDMEV